MNRKIYDRGLAASSVLTSLMIGNAVDPKSVNAAIKSIGTAGAKLDNQVHGTAVACIYLSMSIAEGGPATGAGPALALLNTLPKSAKSVKLGAWFAKFSNIRVKFDKAAKAWTGGVMGEKLKGYAVPQPEAALASPYWDLGPDERVGADFTTDALAKAVKALIGRAKAENAKLDAKGLAALAGLEGLSENLGTVLATVK